MLGIGPCCIGVLVVYHTPPLRHSSLLYYLTSTPTHLLTPTGIPRALTPGLTDVGVPQMVRANFKT